jgi:hypothetical protein
MSITSQDGLAPILVSYAEGEDLYVRPYSIASDWSAFRYCVRWLKPEEFEPYPSWLQDHLWDTSGNYGWRVWRRFRKWFWFGPGRWAASAISHFAYHSRWTWRSPPWRRPRDWWDWLLGWIDPYLMYPVLCLELYPETLGLTGQLRVQDTEELSETHYLVPSDKYISLRLKQDHADLLKRLGTQRPILDLGDPVGWKWDDLEDLGKFLKWKEFQEAMGREVHYLVSLDT